MFCEAKGLYRLTYNKTTFEEDNHRIIHSALGTCLVIILKLIVSKLGPIPVTPQ